MEKFAISGKLRGYLLRSPARSLQTANAEWLAAASGSTILAVPEEA